MRYGDPEERTIPAIREYVWKPSQVIGLLTRSCAATRSVASCPESQPETVKKFRFYGFLKDYNQFNGRHNPTLDIAPGQPVTAMLDGQQRLTSLNIGLRGTYAYKKHRARSNNPDNYPARKLYLNVLGEAEQNEAGLRYDFRFLTDEQLAEAGPQESRYWFPVHRVYQTDDLGDLWDLAGDAGLANDRSARNMLSQLWKAIRVPPASTSTRRRTKMSSACSTSSFE
jgi:hypothetical protein